MLRLYFLSIKICVRKHNIKSIDAEENERDIIYANQYSLLQVKQQIWEIDF